MFSEKVAENEAVLVRVVDGVLHERLKAVTLGVGPVSVVDPETESVFDKEQLTVPEQVGVALLERRKEGDSVGLGLADTVPEGDRSEAEADRVEDHEVLCVCVGVNDVEYAADGDAVEDSDKLPVLKIEWDTEWDAVWVRDRDALSVGRVGDTDGVDDLE